MKPDHLPLDSTDDETRIAQPDAVDLADILIRHIGHRVLVIGLSPRGIDLITDEFFNRVDVAGVMATRLSALAFARIANERGMDVRWTDKEPK